MSSWCKLCFVSVLLILIPVALSCDCNGEKPVRCGPPITNAGEDQEATVGETVVLHGSVRFPPEDKEVCISEKSTLVFRWEQMSGPDVEIEDADKREASFVAMEPGEYRFRFQAIYPITEVNKKEEKPSQWDSVTITVHPVICDAPVADAGPDQVVSAPPNTPRAVYLDGTASHPAHQAGCVCPITGNTWTVESEPAGSTVSITDAGQAEASVEITVPGEYVFQLEVQDDCGTEDRTDTATDTVAVTLRESAGCGAGLEVTAVDAATGDGIANAGVIVLDADGAEHTATTDGSGLAIFDSLAEGTRQSITVVSDQEVAAWELSEDPNPRPRYEITSVVDHCESTITIPLLETRSGEKAGTWGTMVAKVPRSLFNILPHSWRCREECETDDDCDDKETYYCENDPSTACGPKPPQVPLGSCTPRSLLPFFSLGDVYISGQFRVVITIPLYPVDNLSHFPVGCLFAPPPGDEALLPGNLSTDDTFLNGLASALGLDPWGKLCTSTSECGDPADYVCDINPDSGDHECKDKSPLRNIKMELPAGENIRIIALVGIMNVNLMDLLPVLLPMMTGSGSVDFDVGALLGAFKLQTLHVCPLLVDVAEEGNTDISDKLAGLDASKCWNIDYTQMEKIIGLEDSRQFNLDPCNGGNCGWPGSGKMCLDDPHDPGNKKCFTPLFREVPVTNDTMIVKPATTGFDPTAPQADPRLCSWMPAEAPFEKLCESDQGIYIPCENPEFCDVPVPGTVECSFPYGLAVVVLDVPAGNDKLPEGGRVGVSFNFNRTPVSIEAEPLFLIPDLANNGLVDTAIQGAQIYMRNITTLQDGSYEEFPGRLGASAASNSNVAQLDLPEVLPLIEAQNIPDAGFDVKVAFETDDPTVCPPVIDRSYAAAVNMRAPQAGQHDLPATVGYVVSPEHELAGLTLARADRVQPNPPDGAVFEIVDSWWRIYAPVETTSISLPASANPFSAGAEVWLGFWGSAFEVPFDFDLFTNDLILTGQKACIKDDYALIAP